MKSPIFYEPGVLRLVDQRILPTEEKWIHCDTVETTAHAITDMVVRGAPAIGCTAAYGLAVDAHAFDQSKKWSDYSDHFKKSCETLANARPTAINLFFAIDKMKELSTSFSSDLPMPEVANKFDELAQYLFDDDVKTCKQMGAHGAALATEPVTVLTHCNAGALATANYGTALGVIRALHETGKLKYAYADETRPWLQGSRLTSYELKEEGIPHSIIIDSASAVLMAKGKIDWVVVGSDRIAANGDVANKIGTYGLACHCKHHGIKFYVAAPFSTYDPNVPNGDAIPIEERSSKEITSYKDIQIAPDGADALNIAFDVTPHDMITGIITEKGVITAPIPENIARLAKQG